MNLLRPTKGAKLKGRNRIIIRELKRDWATLVSNWLTGELIGGAGWSWWKWRGTSDKGPGGAVWVKRQARETLSWAERRWENKGSQSVRVCVYTCAYTLKVTIHVSSWCVKLLSSCKCLVKSQWVSDTDLVPSIARDIVGAAVDLERISGIIKYTLNLSACTENDLWMNFKQHASFCNLPNEPCGFDFRSDAQHRAKRFPYFYYFPNSGKFQDTVCKTGSHPPIVALGGCKLKYDS